MKRIPCEKCLATMVNARNQLPCGVTRLKMLRLLYAYRHPPFQGAHQTTLNVHEKSKAEFQDITKVCAFWAYPNINPND